MSHQQLRVPDTRSRNLSHLAGSVCWPRHECAYGTQLFRMTTTPPIDAAGRRADLQRNRSGQEAVVTPSGPLRATNVDALIPALPEGQGIAELPGFIANEYLANDRLQILLQHWTDYYDCVALHRKVATSARRRMR